MWKQLGFNIPLVPRRNAQANQVRMNGFASYDVKRTLMDGGKRRSDAVVSAKKHQGIVLRHPPVVQLRCIFQVVFEIEGK